MKTKMLCLAACVLLIVSVSPAKEETLFEDVLRDAEFHPLIITEANLAKINQVVGWWTLKFENGAVVTTPQYTVGLTSKKDIWWIGKTYIVYKKKFGQNYYSIRPKEEEKE
jgi:hypothetical protein